MITLNNHWIAGFLKSGIPLTGKDYLEKFLKISHKENIFIKYSQSN